MAGVILYHGTLSENVPAILKKGILPRTREDCIKLVEELELEEEEEAYTFALVRCLATTGKVYLSGSKKYAIDNCRAGLEVEFESVWIGSLRFDPVLAREALEELKKIPCSVLEVEVPSEVVPKSGGGRWEGEPIGKIMKEAVPFMKAIMPELTEEEAKSRLKEFTFEKVPAEWIKTHYPV